MVKLERMVDFQVAVPDRPGELARFIASLKKENINLRAIWGFGIGGGHAEIICVPEKPKRFRAFAEKAGLQVRERTVVCMNGKDKLGALVGTVEKIASAGINVHAVDAIALSGRYGAYIWVEDKDRQALEKVLGL
jgi:hypothetical protein